MYQINRIGLGTWPFGGHDWSHGWGAQAEDLSEEVTIKALRQGVEIIDTAPAYGLGRAEVIIGNALRRWSGSKPFIASKCGQEWGSNGRFRTNLTPAFIRQGVHESLQRLRVEQVDLMFLHYPSTDSLETHAALEELTKLKFEGKIAHIGISNFSDSDIIMAAREFDIYACQSKYSILDRQVEANTLTICREHGIKFFAYQPLESGLLTGSFFPVGSRVLTKGDWRNRSPLYRKDTLDSLTKLNDILTSIASRHSVAIASVALSWVLQNQACDVALVGIRDCKQLSELIDASKIELTQEERIMIDQSLEVFKEMVLI